MEAPYLIVIENAGDNYLAYSPDLPGCVATGADQTEARDRMAIAIRMHLDGLIEDGLPVPEPRAVSEWVASVDG